MFVSLFLQAMPPPGNKGPTYISDVWISPLPRSNHKLLVIGDYNPDNDNGHPSAFGINFKNKAPINWTIAYSGVNHKPSDGIICLNWNMIVDETFFELVVDNNFDILIAYFPYGGWLQRWQAISSPSMDWHFVHGIRYATEHGVLVLSPHFKNVHQMIEMLPFKNVPSLILVGGGFWPNYNGYSYGPQEEFFDSFSPLDAAESWANQSTAARLARIINEHPSFNAYDVRQYARHIASNGEMFWTDNGGYGFIQLTNRSNDNPNMVDVVKSDISIGPPLEIYSIQDSNSISFFWRNFLQVGWQSTQVKMYGTNIYEGGGYSILRDGPDAQNYGHRLTTIENGFRWVPTFNFTNRVYFYSRVRNCLSVNEPHTFINLVFTNAPRYSLISY